MKKIEWAPLNVPLHRRIETLVAGSWMILILFGELITLIAFLLTLYFGNIYIKALGAIYIAFMYYDRKIGETGGRGQGTQWIRNLSYWRHFRNYFPVIIHKTADLPADKNYMCGLFPHGLLSMAGFITCNSNATTWQKQFPGVRTKLCTLGFHFSIPVFRELVLAWGMSSVSKDNVTTLLSQSNDKDSPQNKDGHTSNAVVIVVGGAQEALYMRPDNFRIVLKKRKGFIKLALKNGASLVPLFSFGELDLYDQPDNPPGSKLRRWQDFVKAVTGIAPTKFIGRGFFQYSYGMIPRRKTLNLVIGKPIDVPKTAEPSNELVDEYHQKFTDGLIELFETNKVKFVKNHETAQLIIE